MTMIRFWGQVHYATQTKKMSGYELFLREQDESGEQWAVPANIDLIVPMRLVRMLEDTLPTLPDKLDHVTLNMNRSQFLNPSYLMLLGRLKQTLDLNLGIELVGHDEHGNEQVPIEKLKQQAAAYQKAGLLLILDEVGTGHNGRELAEALDPYVWGYKYTLQSTRGVLTRDDAIAQVGEWRFLARRQGKQFALSGIETASDVKLIGRRQPDYVQGFYFGKPNPLATLNDLKVEDD